MLIRDPSTVQKHARYKRKHPAALRAHPSQTDRLNVRRKDFKHCTLIYNEHNIAAESHWNNYTAASVEGMSDGDYMEGN